MVRNIHGDKGLCPDCKKRRHEGRRQRAPDFPQIIKTKIEDLHKRYIREQDFQKYFCPVTLPDGYEFSCRVRIDCWEYIIESESSDQIFTEKTKIFIIKEYDLENNCFTGKPWIELGDEEYLEFKVRHFNLDNTKPTPLGQPFGVLYFTIPPI